MELEPGLGAWKKLRRTKKSHIILQFLFCNFLIINELLIIRKLYIGVRRIFFRRGQLSPFRESYKENIKIFFNILISGGQWPSRGGSYSLASSCGRL